MARHTSMAPRFQRTPHGDVTLTSRWFREHYFLVAYGPVAAIQWMFPKAEQLEIIGGKARHTFEPTSMRITVERDLRKICGMWQAHWQQRFDDELPAASAAEAGLTVAPTIETIGQLFDLVLARRQGTVSKMTTDRDRYKLRLWRQELGERKLLSELSAEGLTVALGRIGKRTSPSTANTSFAVVKTYLNWAANSGLMQNQCHRLVRRLKEPVGDRHQRAWWTTQEVELAIKCAAEDPHQPTATLLVACGCYLGLRPEEIIMLRWQDLDLDGVDPRTAEPRPVCHVTPHAGWTPKDGEPRSIPICAPLLTILLQHRQAEGYLLQAEAYRKGRKRGGGKGLDYRYDPKKVWARVMKRVEAVGGKRITMYGMRHSFASNLLIADVSDVKVSRWLGHADTRMVHRVYGHLLCYDAAINAGSVGRAREIDRD